MQPRRYGSLYFHFLMATGNQWQKTYTSRLAKIDFITDGQATADGSSFMSHFHVMLCFGIEHANRVMIQELKSDSLIRLPAGAGSLWQNAAVILQPDILILVPENKVTTGSRQHAVVSLTRDWTNVRCHLTPTRDIPVRLWFFKNKYEKIFLEICVWLGKPCIVFAAVHKIV